MAYDSAATRGRLLDAAYREFASRGLAGARVDRIAAAARANKQAIYVYFGSKDELFDTVLADRLGMLADTVPFTPNDVPGYAGALVDALVAEPDLLRLTRWRALERAEPTPGEVTVHKLRARQLRAALDLPDDETAFGLFEIIVAICTASVGSPLGFPARRALVLSAVAAITGCHDRTEKCRSPGVDPDSGWRPRSRSSSQSCGPRGGSAERSTRQDAAGHGMFFA